MAFMIVNGNSNTDIRDWQEVRVLGFKVELSTKKNGKDFGINQVIFGECLNK